jgi:hypothetical protein
MYAYGSAVAHDGKTLAYFPDNLGHIQRLADSELKDGSDTLKVLDSTFHLCPLNPSRTE